MLPLQLAGLALAGRTLLSKYSGTKDKSPLPSKSKAPTKPRPQIKYAANKTSPAINPIQTLVKGITSTLSQITTQLAGEDYNAVVKNFLPGNVKLLKPQYPANTDEIQFADLDGDSRDELITSYKHNNEVKTIILKKQNNQWHKAAEIGHPEYDVLKYRNTADIAGEGKQQLLIGMSSKGKAPVLYGYSLENNNLNKLFAQNFHRFEVLHPSGNRNIALKARLAVWKKRDADAYDIDVMHWNGLQLEPLKDSASYFYRKVVPYYVQKVKQLPTSPSNWYNLADALSKAGVQRDALTAIDVGMSLDPNAMLKEKFSALRNMVTQVG